MCVHAQTQILLSLNFDVFFCLLGANVWMRKPYTQRGKIHELRIGMSLVCESSRILFFCSAEFGSVFGVWHSDQYGVVVIMKYDVQ